MYEIAHFDTLPQSAHRDRSLPKAVIIRRRDLARRASLAEKGKEPLFSAEPANWERACREEYRLAGRGAGAGVVREQGLGNSLSPLRGKTPQHAAQGAHVRLHA